MSKNTAFVYFYTSNHGKSHLLHDSDIFWLKIRIPDKNNLFATLLTRPGKKQKLTENFQIAITFSVLFSTTIYGKIAEVVFLFLFFIDLL